MQLSEIFKLSSFEAAPLLLGCFISRYTDAGMVKLMIVETEAYHQDDPASHSFRGLTPRTAPMFEAGGRLYVYFTYGMHYCVNIVVGPKGVGEAVLLRAAQPLEGLDIMRRNRGVDDPIQLANGPAKLAQALGIADTSLSGKKLLNMLSNSEKNKLARHQNLSGAVGNRIAERQVFGAGSSILLEPPDRVVKPSQIIAGPRIGIRRAIDAPWRFYINNNPYVSKPGSRFSISPL